MYALIATGIFILICCIIAWYYANKRSYKDDSLRYVDKENEVDHVLQQHLNIEKIKAFHKASKQVKVESDGFSLGSVIGGLLSFVIAIFVIANVVLPVIRELNESSSLTSSGEVALWGVVTLVSIAGGVYYLSGTFGLVD